jgi:hypothetical protein
MQCAVPTSALGRRPQRNPKKGVAYAPGASNTIDVDA